MQICFFGQNILEERHSCETWTAMIVQDEVSQLSNNIVIVAGSLSGGRNERRTIFVCFERS